MTAATDKFKTAGALAAKLEKAQSAIDKRYKDLEAKMPAALKAKNAPVVRICESAAAALEKDISSALTEVNRVVNQCVSASSDPAFISNPKNFADVEKLTTRATTLRTTLTTQLKHLKQWQNEVDKSVDDYRAAEEHILSRMGIMQSDVLENRELAGAALKQGRTLKDKADKAVAARDAKALAEAQKSVLSLKLPELAESLRSATGQFTSFLNYVAGCKPSAAALAEAKDGVEDLRKEQRDWELTANELESLHADVTGAKIAAIDLDKAARVLGIGAAHKSKLAAALKGPPSGYEKGLTALAKELKLPMSGKDMLEALEESRLL